MYDYIGIVGMGFVGRAVCYGFFPPFKALWLDKKEKMYFELAGRVETYKELVEKVDGPIFVCVPTPMHPDGTCDLSIVENVVLELDKAASDLKKTTAIVIKSTVPPGTTRGLPNAGYLQLCFNPEFLREGTANHDFKKQDRIILGGDGFAVAAATKIYRKVFPDVPIYKTTAAVAEMVKYTANCFLATKVSFANEIAALCRNLSIDYDKVIEYATKDPRLGTTHWAVPGPDGENGFGGSCFPKDLNGLIALTKKHASLSNVLQGAWQTNLAVRPEKDWELLKGRAVSE